MTYHQIADDLKKRNWPLPPCSTAKAWTDRAIERRLIRYDIKIPRSFTLVGLKEPHQLWYARHNHQIWAAIMSSLMAAAGAAILIKLMA